MRYYASATKKEVDARMNEYLKEEKMGKAAAIVFQASYEDVKDLEEEVGHLKREEHERRMFLKELDAQRELIVDKPVERRCRDEGCGGSCKAPSCCGG